MKYAKPLIAFGILAVLGIGLSYASANTYDTEGYADAVRTVMLAAAAYLGTWFKSE